ncbi:MAG TPA: response regulator [Ktedonobacterales bacterium]|nr:response regulator [Ktedonobacterales bacterium]
MAQVSRPTVLIVDDDACLRDALGELLLDAGYAVRMAADGREGLSLLRAATERLVALVDVVMPNMDGIELLNQLAGDRTLAVRHAYALMSAQPRLLCAALTDLLLTLSVPVVIKPFDTDILLMTVAELARRVAWPQPSAAQ